MIWKLWTVSCSVVTLHNHFQLGQVTSMHIQMQGHCVPSNFASVEEKMYSMQQKVDRILWFVQFKLYTHVKCLSNLVYPNEAAPIYRSVMCLDETGGVLQQNGPPDLMVSQDNVKHMNQIFQRSPCKFRIRPASLNCAWCSAQQTKIACLQASVGPEDNIQKSEFE